MKVNKIRLTITLSANTLNKIDQLIDKKKIRSRSHAIETILQKQLTSNITTAVILAGNKSTKQKLIRPLILVKQKPLIFHTLELLHKYGVNKIYILAQHQIAKIKKTLSKHKLAHQFKIIYIAEKQALGTAGAIKQLSEKINHPFFVLHGDILTDINLQDLAQFHDEHLATATIAVKPRVPQNYYSNVFIQGNKVVDFAQRKKGQIVSIVNTGIYVFSSNIFKHLPDKTPAALENDVFPQLAQKNQLLAFPFQGLWFDVTVDNNYQKK